MQYAAFTQVCSRAGGDAGPAAGTSSFQLPNAPAQEASSAEERTRIFELARKVQAEHQAWVASKDQEEASRRERAELMKVASGDSPTRQAQEASLAFCMPDGRQVNQNMPLSKTAFDVYTKAYDLLQRKERAFTMKVVGPRGSNRVTRELDEATFGMLLSDLGIQSSGIFDVKVVQP
mmetsp:Transcript_95467/g.169505  ORF Transcript_95467/g.169505 Transcript_95467/m.169505 type:complete len:177 (-) Transcript_95467:64-594(-)